ncbi:MAG: 4Fe-4S dicluster domain-containing protein [Desulfobacterium sp.]|nr:4Fe-4S dicluster domain-containing protein [Desulfobacterium sp.]
MTEHVRNRPTREKPGRPLKIKIATIRAISAAVMMVLFILFFMDVHPATTGFLGQTVAGFQFFTSLVGLASGSMKATLLFTLLLLLSMVFGRIYCAVLCPLGIFQDMMIFLSRRYGKRKGIYPKHPKSYPFLWYAILMLTALLFFAGSLILINVLDPFSIFGRFCTLLILAVLSGMNNLLVSLTEHFHLFILTPVTPGPVLWPLFFITYAWLIMVTFMAFYHGRLYCNTLCPVGAFFSLFSRVALFRFSIDEKRCTACGKCGRICRAGCVDPVGGSIDLARCVACFDCMDVCPENAITYRAPALSTREPLQTRRPHSSCPAVRGATALSAKEMPQALMNKGVQKRQFLLTSLAAGGGIMALGLPLGTALARITWESPALPFPVTPPGSLGVEHFSRNCVACLACVSVCPENVIQPGLTDYGMAGIIQPGLDFTRSRCAYTCRACTLVCPSGAILPLSLEKKQRTRIARVVFKEKRCLVHTHKRDCGACAEVCPTHAVHTIRENNIHHPRLKPDACIGCGACQQVCPVNPKAIYVEAARVHETAAPPFFQKQEEKTPEKGMGPGDDFPF